MKLDLFLIVDRAVYTATEGKAGFKGLQEGEEVMIGKRCNFRKDGTAIQQLIANDQI